jgi:hypothetical protein
MHPPSLEITPPSVGGSASFGSLTGSPGDNAALAAALGAKLNLTGGTLTGLLDFSGTTHAGVRLNNLTTTQRNALASPQAGMTVWNTTTARLNIHNGTGWTDGFVRLAGDTMTGPLGITSGTITANAPLLNLSQTWNNAGVTFTGLFANITDTASNAASLLLNLQVGGVTQMSVNKAGTVAATTFRLTGNTGSGVILRDAGSGAVGINANGVQVMDIRGGNVSLGANPLSWGSTPVSSQDLILERDAANILALRNGTNAQTFRVHGTFTDASNHRRINLSMTTAGVAVLRAEGAGTGATGNVLHISSLPTSNPGPNILWNNAGTPAIGT